MLLVLLALGCDSGTTNHPVAGPRNNTSSSATAETPSSTPTTNGATNQSSSQSSRAASSDTPQAPIETVKTPTPPPPPSEFNPTPEQLARWKQPAFDRLELLAAIDSNQLGFVSEAAALPDGKHFVLAGTKLTVWSVGEDQPKHVLLDLTREDERSLTALEVDPKGEWVAAGDNKGQLSIYGLADQTERSKKQLYPTGIVQVAISPDSQEIATISHTSEVAIWNADSLEPKNRFKLDISGLQKLEYLAPGKLVVAGASSAIINTETGKVEQELSPARYQQALVRSQDGTQLLFGAEGGLNRISPDDLNPKQVLQGDFTSDRLASLSEDKRLLALSAGQSILIFDLPANQLVQGIDGYGPAITGLRWLPQSNLLLVASETGRVRLWGDKTATEKSGLQPVHEAEPAITAALEDPATPSQLLRTMDLRDLPKLPGTSLALGSALMVGYDTPTPVEETIQYYRYWLKQAGWKEGEVNPHTPNYRTFEKAGFRVFLSATEIAGQTNVQLTNSGNVDVRKLPQFKGGKTAERYMAIDSATYDAKSDLLKIETELLKKIHEQGWTPYSRLHASQNEEPDARSLQFLKNGSLLDVSIRRFPTSPDSYTVQYSAHPTLHSLPIPTDCSYVEFDGSVKPSLVAITSLSLDQTREFYDEQLAKQGWLVREKGRSLKEDHAWLSYLQGQCDLTIGLKQLDNQKTLIRVGEYLENSSWQLKGQAKDTSKDAPQSADGGLEAADFPILNDSKEAKYSPDNKQIEFKMPGVPLLTVADKYIQAMEELGWKLTREGIKSDDYVFLNFGKGKLEIDLRAHKLGNDASLNIQGDGFAWSKPLPGGKQLCSYEAWLRQSSHPATLELLDEYAKEMSQLNK